MAFLDPVLNPLLQPLLNASPFWLIVVLSFAVSAIITLVYKLMTNQVLMKSMKERQKEYSKQMKELRSEPEKMMKVQKEAMKANMDYMKLSFKPTLVTMLPIILLFGWMAGHLAYEPIYPGETYSITAMFDEGVTGIAELVVNEGTESQGDTQQNIVDQKASWELKSNAGKHLLGVKVGNLEQTKTVLITKELKYETAIKTYEHSDIKKIQINYKELKPMGQQEIFGWAPGWLGMYIILSIIFSMVLRKGLKIY